MGAYGGFLEFFPELFQPIELYTQKPLETAGYKDKTLIGTFRVIFQSTGDDGITGPAGRLSNKSQWRTLDFANNETMWSMQKLPVGSFFKNQYKDNAIYRVVKNLDFYLEGGYYEWGIQRVTGDSGEQSGHLTINKGLY
jgi:hypothetical protein